MVAILMMSAKLANLDLELSRLELFDQQFAVAFVADRCAFS